jgi:hypothetical protein
MCSFNSVMRNKNATKSMRVAVGQNKVQLKNIESCRLIRILWESEFIVKTKYSLFFCQGRPKVSFVGFQFKENQRAALDRSSSHFIF